MCKKPAPVATASQETDRATCQSKAVSPKGMQDSLASVQVLQQETGPYHTWRGRTATNSNSAKTARETL